ncbi:ADP-ribosyl cyclase/cyclic ADP-ribose hydrolase [Citrus sinensis]|uniref:ADP-ribosyl cyclase/cyclic ADP-ribose hydrolase n=1 Tax=Citrus sinensis TaxID=2711 RepID=A0ACB8I2H7_CITSI|nr:ADP-ribosyl cyclase/cyclic ADP-ribose hydrolase [Citrus sinensis]
MKEKKLTVIGTVDPVNVMSKLRKYWSADIILVGPAKEPEKPKEELKKEEPKKKEEAKKEEPKKEEPKKEEPKKEEEKKEEEKKQEAAPAPVLPSDPVLELVKAYRAYNPYLTTHYHVQSIEENPNALRRQHQDIKLVYVKAAAFLFLSMYDNESEFIEKIVNVISSKIRTELEIPKELVGMESRLEKLKFFMCTGSNDVRTIGIWGMGGLGKTTLARVVYDLMSHEFDGSSFLADVRERCDKEGSVISLQKQLLSDLLMLADNSIRNVYDGVNMIGSRLRHKKVLLLIDDVADVEQLRGLFGKRDWFGLGSMIIITTRDEHLLKLHRVEEVYKLEALNFDEAFRLFCLKAFDTYKPLEEYLELAKCFVKYASGLPLAVDVLVSFLFGRPVDQWRSTQERLKRDPENKILEMGQQIVRRQSPDEPGRRSRLWEEADVSHVLSQNTGSEVIEGIMVDDNSLENWVYFSGSAKAFSCMTNLRLLKISSLQLPEGLECLSNKLRLLDWHRYPLKSLPSNLQLGKIVEFKMCYSRIEELWKGIKPLNMLKVMKLRHSENLIKTPDLTEAPNLEELDLKGCTRLREIHSSLLLRNKLILLNLKGCTSLTTLSSKIFMKSLKTLVLSGCLKLRKFPHVAGSMECLRELLLDGTDIKELPVSIELLSGLVQLSLKGCKNLLSLPIAISSLKCLRNLKLSGCSKLKKFPQIVASMEDLLELYLDGTSITEVPSSIELLPGLELLNLNNCKNLVRLPNNINGLKSLKTLNLSGCFKLENMPETVGQVESLEELDISGTAIRRPPSSIFLMKNLRALSFSGCSGPPSSTLWHLHVPFNLMGKSSYPVALMLYSLSGLCSLIKLDISDCNLGEGAIPSDIGNLCSLKELYLSRNNFVTLPASISGLLNLKELELEDCKRLQSLPQIPPNLWLVRANGCSSLVTLSGALNLRKSEYTVIDCIDSLKLLGKNGLAISILREYLEAVSNPSHKLSIVVPGSEIPKWFMYQNEGSSITVTRPSYFYNMNKVVGYAICCVFHVPKHSIGIKIWRSYATYQLECSMDGSGTISYIDFREIFGHCGSDHLWLLYLSRQRCYDTNWHFESNHFRLSFIDFREKFGMAGSDPVLKVKRFSFHPVYMHEVEEFDQTTKQWTCFTSYNLNEFHHDFVGSDMAVAEARGSVCWDDYDEEPQPKRFRPLE